MTKKILIEIFSKPGEWAEVVPGESIRLFGAKKSMTTEAGFIAYETKFEIGDTAEYDSFNLSYTGKIVSITAKTVTIQPPLNDKKRRLKIDTFQWRNWDFDAAETARKNSETMMYI